MAKLMEKAMNSVQPYDKPEPQRRLTRSPHGMIAGVCAGLSDCFGFNLIFIRIIFIVLGLAQGIGLIAYLILAVVIPATPPPNVAGPVATYARRSPIRTFFACIAAGLSVCATLLAFFKDASSIFYALMALMTSY